MCFYFYFIKNKILEILKNSINSFGNKENVELIATFGSIIKSDKPDFDDLDIIMISDENSHDEFISHLKSKFNGEGFRPVVFKTIEDKPKRMNKNELFIHDLNYRGLNDLLKRQWKGVVNTMKTEMVILYGDKNYSDKIPLRKLNKKDIRISLGEWVKEIKSEWEFSVFYKYLVKTLPRFRKYFAHLKLDLWSEVEEILQDKGNWKDKLQKLRVLF